VIVKSGTGAIEMGDSLVGSELRAAGERIGGKFHRSYQIVVHAGDMVRIPAVVPHQLSSRERNRSTISSSSSGVTGCRFAGSMLVRPRVSSSRSEP
jgi:mannose-6-phosphate isomerase-like protein (cupin superfamily)